MHPTTQSSTLAQLKGRIARKWKTDSSVASIFRNMTMLASGTVAARAIGVLTVPVITRLYLPEHFGVLSVFAAITALLMPYPENIPERLLCSSFVRLSRRGFGLPLWYCSPSTDQGVAHI